MKERRKLKDSENVKAASYRSDFRSLGIRHEFHNDLRNYCVENKMIIVDFVEAACRYAMANQMKVKTTITIDHGTLPKGDSNS